MNAPPMRPWQTRLALLAAIPIALALLPFDDRVRIALIALGAGILILIFVFRMRAVGVRRQSERTLDVYTRIEMLREERNKKYGKRR